MELKYFLPKELPPSLMGFNDDLLNNDPKNPSDSIILEIWGLENFMLVEILLLNTFLSFIFLSCCP